MLCKEPTTHPLTNSEDITIFTTLGDRPLKPVFKLSIPEAIAIVKATEDNSFKSRTEIELSSYGATELIKLRNGVNASRRRTYSFDTNQQCCTDLNKNSTDWIQLAFVDRSATLLFHYDTYTKLVADLRETLNQNPELLLASEI